jgi:hypothetical protein
LELHNGIFGTVFWIGIELVLLRHLRVVSYVQTSRVHVRLHDMNRRVIRWTTNVWRSSG